MDMPEPDEEAIEVELFLLALHRRHGYDLRNYAQASLRRRVKQTAENLADGSILDLTTRLMREPDLLPQIIGNISVPVSEMFRDPWVFKALRDEVLPVLASWPRIVVWQAGCAHGEETYSLAILLEEAGLYDRTTIHATDFSDMAIERAREGIYPLRYARDFARSYLEAGGLRTFTDYCHAGYEHFKLDERLKRNIHFQNHNLNGDGPFCEAQLILCRNVLIYFDNALQDHTIGLFTSSLARGGFLCLGTKESLQFSKNAAKLTPVDKRARIFRKVEVRHD